MVVNEIDSLIQKFHQLWSAGVSAHLDLDTHAGEAWVGLRVRLGPSPAPGHLHHHFKPFQKHESPSRQRRRARRDAARRAKAEESAVQVVTAKDAEKVSSGVTESVAKEVVKKAFHVVDVVCSDVDYSVNNLCDEVAEDFVDELYSEEEYTKQAKEYLETFEVIQHDSGKSESEILSKTKNFLNQTFKFCNVKREDRDFKVVTSEKFEGGLKITLQVKNIPEVIQSVEGLKTLNTEVWKLPK